MPPDENDALLIPSDFWQSVAKLSFKTEAEVELRLLLPLLAALGYDRAEITPKASIVFQTGRRGRPHEADFIVHVGTERSPDTSLLVVEAKAPLKDLAAAAQQAESYAHASRAPFLLLSDGVVLEIWQMQATQASERVLACRVAELNLQRGRIEQLIGRNAAISHCRVLAYKSLSTVSNDISDYIAAELSRVASTPGVARRLHNRSNSRTLESIAFFDTCEKGAFVVAPSGYGKTTLALDLHRHALATCSDSGPVPVYISLAELAELDQAPDVYARERMAAHCPQFTSPNAFHDLLASRGARVICDGLDRIGQSEQRTFFARAATLLRDRPRVQLIILGRTEVANGPILPIYELLPLDREERYALASLVVGYSAAMALHRLPDILDPLCEHPLLLTLLLQHQQRTGSSPSRLDQLFETWLRQLLEFESHGPAAVLRLRGLLARIAVAISGPTGSRHDLFSMIEGEGDATDQLDSLVRSGALIIGPQVELCHDALGDYLRAEAVLARPREAALAHVAQATFTAGSFYPLLLMSMCQDAEVRTALWQRLCEAGLDVYLDVLRYHNAPDPTSLPSDDDMNSTYLEAFRRGIVDPVISYIPQLQTEIFSVLARAPAGRLGVYGQIGSNRKWFHYGFFPATPDEVATKIPRNAQDIIGGYSLERHEGAKDARFSGMERLCSALGTLIVGRRLTGGAEWYNDRLLGRLRFATRQWRDKVPLDVEFGSLEHILAQHAQETIYLGNWDRSFHVSEMMDDVQALRNLGRTKLDPWWLQFNVNLEEENSDRTQSDGLLNEYWRRSQLIFKELIDHSFAPLANSLQFFQALPVRYSVELYSVPDFGRGMAYAWFPVADWSEAGADVEFTFRSGALYNDETYGKVQNELARLGRSCSTFEYVQGPIPHFDGGRRFGTFDGETPAIRTALEMLTKDLNRLLSRAPGLQLRRGAFSV